MEFTYSLYNNRCPFVFCRKYTRKELKLVFNPCYNKQHILWKRHRIHYI